MVFFITNCIKFTSTYKWWNIYKRNHQNPQDHQQKFVTQPPVLELMCFSPGRAIDISGCNNCSKRQNMNGTAYMVCWCLKTVGTKIFLTGTPHHHLDKEDPSVIEKKLIQQFSVLKRRPRGHYFPYSWNTKRQRINFN